MSPLRHSVIVRAAETTAESSTAPLITGPYPPLTQPGKSLIAVSVIMVFFTTAWTVMRIISRNIRKSQYYIEDYFYFVGQILYYVLAALFILVVVDGGAGHDLVRLAPDVSSKFSRFTLAIQVAYSICLCFIKVAVICMIRRIFRTAGRFFVMATWAATVLSVIWALYGIILPFVLCKPVESAWGAARPEKCGDIVMAHVAVAVLDIVSEVAIVALPMKMVYNLHMNRAHKLAMVAVFGAGFVTIIFSCVRLYYIYIGIQNISKISTGGSISTALQAGIAIMVASSPMLRPIFDRTALKWLGISLRSTREESTGGAVRSRATGGGGTRRTSQGPSHTRPGGFQQMHESEEHLAWEMATMNGKFNG
ncbi:hypothetical protein BGZ61DRAFT_377080 [Ilyonectria robusta]|uniref:uncharacterized protein n=1 Tax=Ilyonectria robusta TaxID=1079257 RepID=UPI001E8E88A2|nr:uncharacterized protein BGZ61DRAFT_377080 [Ilyonectria robusta]KAH8645872.1 hypothetical protein BGZ61DRAFT_377080 [Ilyonectria robusta]